MALETVRVAVSAADYVQIGDNVTALTATETLVGGMRIYIVATGGTAPASAAHASYQHWDGEYSFSGPAADVYVLSPNGATTVGVVRS
jgi:hypothetical protein